MKLMRDLVGATLSHRYRLVARLAGGGMGEVYRAHDLLLDRPVAVKVLQPSLAADPELVARFKAEARAAARLAHPNVVGVHDWGCEDEETYYMVMEYVAGNDLRDLLVGHGALEPAQALEIAACVCDALAAAHQRGLVHRDVKPENVLVAHDGKVKVADFGIAVVVDPERRFPGGSVLGTLRYLAPEQARGEEATPAADIWAAGAVLAELLTGQPPGQGAGSDLLRRRAEETPLPPSAALPGIHRDIDAIVLKACALDPAARYRDASEMANELRRVAVRSVPDAPPLTSLLGRIEGEEPVPDMTPTSFMARPKRKRGKVRKLVRVALLGVLLSLLLLGGVQAATWLMPQPVKVPSLIGLSHGNAAEKAEESGLHVEVVRRVKSEEYREGAVIKQDPASGMVKEGSTIELVLSAGPPPVRVPQLVGLAQRDAEILLRSSELDVGSIRSEYSLKPKGTVIRQDPARGKLPWGGDVDLVVSKGPEPVSVPQVAGMTTDEAVTVLEDAGFDVQLSEVFSNDVEAGIVIETQPAAGQTQPRGTTITVVVSSGPEFKQLRMPDVRGMHVDDARARLDRLGLRVDVRRSCKGGPGVVAETDPLAGMKVRENDLVALFVC